MATAIDKAIAKLDAILASAGPAKAAAPPAAAKPAPKPAAAAAVPASKPAKPAQPAAAADGPAAADAFKAKVSIKVNGALEAGGCRLGAPPHGLPREPRLGTGHARRTAMSSPHASPTPLHTPPPHPPTPTTPPPPPTPQPTPPGHPPVSKPKHLSISRMSLSMDLGTPMTLQTTSDSAHFCWIALAPALPPLPPTCGGA
jgi:hypothetical protein